MEYLNDLLHDEFPEWQKFHSLIIFTVAIILGLMQIIQTIYISQSLAKLNNKLKEKEIKFSRLHNLQIEGLKTLYSKIVDVHYANRQLFFARKSDFTHKELKNRILQWNQKFIEFHYFYSQNKILFSIDLNTKIQRFMDQCSSLRNLLLNQKDDLEELEEIYSGDWEYMYEYKDNEISAIENRLNRIRDSEETKINLEEYEVAKQLIETEFREVSN
jgi:adenylate kinase family enzyme